MLRTTTRDSVTREFDQLADEFLGSLGLSGGDRR
jgi:hypothetical protein